MIDRIELLVNEYPDNLHGIEGITSAEDLLKVFRGRTDRALKIHGMKRRNIKVNGYEWQTEVEGYDSSELRQMGDTTEVDKVTKSMVAAFGENAQDVRGYEFENYLDGTAPFPEIPSDGITPDQSAILLLGRAKQNLGVALGMTYSELFVPHIGIFAAKPPVKANRIFRVFPQDGKPSFTQLDERFPNNLYFQMRYIQEIQGPKLQRNIEWDTEEFSGEANLIQRVYHDFQKAYASTLFDTSKVM